LLSELSISYQLPHLEKLGLQVCLTSAGEQFLAEHDVPIATNVHGGGREKKDNTEFLLGPVMVFAESKMTIEAVDKMDLGPEWFGKIKTALEINVWRQLLRMRTKRDSRRITRIRRALETLHYDDVQGLREEELAVGTAW
jgi:hypothetical protein